MGLGIRGFGVRVQGLGFRLALGRCRMFPDLGVKRIISRTICSEGVKGHLRTAGLRIYGSRAHSGLGFRV